MSDDVRRLVRAIEIGLLDLDEVMERALVLTPQEQAQLRAALAEE